MFCLRDLHCDERLKRLRQFVARLANLRGNRDHSILDRARFQSFRRGKRIAICETEGAPEWVTNMGRVLVVVLDHREFDCVGYPFPSPSKNSSNLAVNDPLRSGSPERSNQDLLNSQMEELRQFSCDCQIATSLPEADALLAERHFDSVLFDLDIFDGNEHRLMSQLSGSAASLFSRLDVEDGCWWFPANLMCGEGWEFKSIMPMGHSPVLREVLRQLVSGTCQDPSRQATPSAQFLAGIPRKDTAGDEETSKDSRVKARWTVHRTGPALQKEDD